jgi:hypothetical protein
MNSICTDCDRKTVLAAGPLKLNTKSVQQIRQNSHIEVAGDVSQRDKVRGQ